MLWALWSHAVLEQLDEQIPVEEATWRPDEACADAAAIVQIASAHQHETAATAQRRQLGVEVAVADKKFVNGR